MAHDLTYAYAGDIIAKRNEEGELIVYGKATGPDLDLDQQICDAEWLKSAMPEWMRTGGNIREQHSSIAAGIGLEIDAQGNDWFLKSEVVDPVTAKKVEKKVLKGYSIGIRNARVVKDIQAPNGRIVAGDIVEISLVDRPANPTARIEIAKSIGGNWVFKTEENGVVEPNAEGTEDVSVVAEPIVAPVEVPVVDEGDLPNTVEALSVDESKTLVPEILKGGPGSGPQEGHEFYGNGATSKNDYALRDKADKAQSAADYHRNEAEAHYKEWDSLRKTGGDESQARSAYNVAQAHENAQYAHEHVAIALENPDHALSTSSLEAKAQEATMSANGMAEKHQTEYGTKAVDAQILKTVAGEVTKMASHDPATLEAVRAGLITLLNAELAEMASGEEDETSDVYELLNALCTFLCWWKDEADEQEAPQPFTMVESEEKESDTMAYVGLGVDPQIIKSATAEDASDEARAELRAEIVKALGLDDEISTYKETLTNQQEAIKSLEATVEEMKSLAVGGGPVLRQTTVQARKSADVERMRAEASRLRKIASELENKETASAYISKALELEKDASSISRY